MAKELLRWQCAQSLSDAKSRNPRQGSVPASSAFIIIIHSAILLSFLPSH